MLNFEQTPFSHIIGDLSVGKAVEKVATVGVWQVGERHIQNQSIPNHTAVNALGFGNAAVGY